MTKSVEKNQTENNPEFSARLLAVQAAYQRLQNDQPLATIIREYADHRKAITLEDGEVLAKPDMVLFKKILISLDDRQEEIQSIINGHLIKKEAEQAKEVEPLLKAVLLCGTAEILCHTDIDKALIINDYLNVTHAFYEKKQVSLVNGILDSVCKILKK